MSLRPLSRDWPIGASAIVPALRAGSPVGELALLAPARRRSRPHATSGARRRLRAPWRWLAHARQQPRRSSSSRSASSDQGRRLSRRASVHDASLGNRAWGRRTQRASRTGPRSAHQRLKADRSRAGAFPVGIARGASHEDQPRQVVTAAPGPVNQFRIAPDGAHSRFRRNWTGVRPWTGPSSAVATRNKSTRTTTNNPHQEEAKP